MLLRLVTILSLLISTSLVAAEDYSLWDVFTSEEKNEKFLPPDQAFQLDAIIQEKAVLIRWQIAEGYYLYKEKTAVRNTSIKDQNQHLDFPPSITHDDPEFGKVEIYRNSLVLKNPLSNFSSLPAVLTLEIDFQGCADAGLCYPPITKLLQVKTNLGQAPKPSKHAFGLNSLSLHSLILSFLGFGLLLSLTPCVFPMVPILSGILVGSRTGANSSKALYISSVYVVFMAITYSLLGILVAILGSIGVILAAAYILWLYKRVVFGKLENANLKKIQDINPSEGFILLILCIVVIFFGFYPEPLLETMRVSVDNLVNNYNLEISERVSFK